jgi:hypothetical protein
VSLLLSTLLLLVQSAAAAAAAPFAIAASRHAALIVGYDNENFTWCVVNHDPCSGKFKHLTLLWG